MRLTSRTGLAIRAAVAALSTTGVLFTVFGFVVIWTGIILLNAHRFEAFRGVSWLTLFAFSAVVVVPLYVWGIRVAIRTERRELLDETALASESSRADAASVEKTVGRLATQFDVPFPDVRIHPASEPLAYTTYRADDPVFRTGRATPVLVVSAGLLDALAGSELEAVLAHEFAHLVNDDLRLLSWLLVPLVAAEGLDDRPPSNFIEVIGRVGVIVASAGIGVFTRGRELAADSGAAAATGEPAALAAALERLDETASEKPATDLRDHAHSMNAVNVLPTLAPDRGRFGLHATHPPLEVRLERLRSMTRSTTRRDEHPRPKHND